MRHNLYLSVYLLDNVSASRKQADIRTHSKLCSMQLSYKNWLDAV